MYLNSRVCVLVIYSENEQSRANTARDLRPGIGVFFNLTVRSIGGGTYTPCVRPQCKRYSHVLIRVLLTTRDVQSQ